MLYKQMKAPANTVVTRHSSNSQGEQARPLLKLPIHRGEKAATAFYILKGKILSGKKCGESPGAKFSRDLKTHLGCLSILYFLTLIFITVW